MAYLTSGPQEVDLALQSRQVVVEEAPPLTPTPALSILKSAPSNTSRKNLSTLQVSPAKLLQRGLNIKSHNRQHRILAAAKIEELEEYMLIRLIYMSRSTGELNLQDVQDILTVARANNSNLDISGMLCYEQKYFLQALEGDRSAVNELYLEIADDPRHDEIVIISYEYVDNAVFGSWTMGFAPASDHFYTLLNEIGHNSFNPKELTPEQAFSFLHKLSQQAN